MNRPVLASFKREERRLAAVVLVGRNGQVHVGASLSSGPRVRVLTPRATPPIWDSSNTELKHGESKSLAALKQTNTVGDATSSFMRNYERPGVAALGSRDAYANAAFNSPNAPSMPNLQGPQISPEQADIPASSFHMVNHTHIHMDSEEMSEHVMQHVISGGPTAASGSTGYDQKMHPMIPGTSPPQW